jgi:hypothetical protein
MILSGPIQSWPSRRLSGVKRTCPEASGWAGDDPFRTSDGNASPGLRARDLVPETDQGQSHCRGKLNGLSTIPKKSDAAIAVDQDGRPCPASAATRVITGTYPAPVRAWISRHGGLSGRVLLLRGQELTALYPSCG